jgi:hypothetical protein
MRRQQSNPLPDHRSIWERKGVLRLVYDDFYDRIAAACRPGLTIEIGGGIGNLKRRLADLIPTDILCAPWLDCVADAQRLPFADARAANIVKVAVLHHLIAGRLLPRGRPAWSDDPEHGPPLEIHAFMPLMARSRQAITIRQKD